jgi:hypothetical protein
MDRRYFIGVVGSTLIAGCGTNTDSENGDTTSEPVDDTSPDDAPTDEPNETETSTPDTVAEAETLNSELKISEGEYRTTAAVTGSIQNTGNVTLLICNAVGKFYNSNDELLNTSGWQIMGLFPEEIWIPWLQYTGDGSKVERATLEVDSTNPAQEEFLYTGGDSFSIEESDVQIPADETATPRITAKVRNETGSEVARVRFIGKLYDENRRVLAHGTRVVSNFAADEVWDVEAAINLGQPQVEAINSHELLFYSPS